MAVSGTMCVNRHNKKHSMISLTSPSDVFNNTTKVTKVVATYGADPTAVEYAFNAKTVGDARRRRIHLKGEATHKRKHTFGDEPVTGTLQITLATNSTAGPDVPKITSVVFVDDTDAPDGP